MVLKKVKLTDFNNLEKEQNYNFKRIQTLSIENKIKITNQNIKKNFKDISKQLKENIMELRYFSL